MPFAPIALAAASLYVTASAHAHGGHGAGALSHWHATDTFGLLLVAVLAGAAIWLGRK